MKKHTPFPPTLVLLIGIFAISFGSILVRLAQDVNTYTVTLPFWGTLAQGNAPSLAIAAGRVAVAALILLPICLATKQDELRHITRRDGFLAILSGTMLAAHFATWISSLEYTTVASSTVLVTTSPLWVGLLSPLILKENLPQAMKAGIGLALVGSTVIALDNISAGEAGGSHPLLGNGLALLGAWLVAIYFLLGRRLRPAFSLITYTTIVYGVAAIVLLLVVWGSGLTMWGYNWQTYALFILMALVPQLLGHQSFNWALGYLPASYVSVAVVSEPIGASILALLIFGETPTRWVVVGGVIILIGIVLASRNQT